jgi:tetratricopeptide (TPR) repeat protein
LTGGNPRLLEIYAALRKSADPNEEIELERTPSMKPLFNRLWKRLSEDEKQLLMGLSVFRSIAPIDVWRHQLGLESLKGRNLLKLDAQGGVSLLPVFRELIYEELPLQQRHQLDQSAAVIRAQHGQYTEAAYHLMQADQFEVAVELWYHNQDMEIEQGNASAAYILFKDAKPSGLAEQTAKQLRVIQDRLSLLHGNAASVLENIDSYSWHLDEKITADALDLRGQAHLILGQMDRALSDFDGAISVLGEVSLQIVQLHRRRGQMYIEQAALDLAESETRLAQFEIEQLKALIEIAQGNYLQAQGTLKTARQIAEASSDAKRIAKTDQMLAIAAGNHGDYVHARQYAQAATSYFERVGDRLSLENLRAEVAGFYLNQRKFAEAIAPLETALRFFENIKHDLRIGYLSSNLAEAYYETGKLELAEQYALRAIQSENPRVQPYACYTLGHVRYAQDKAAESEHIFQIGISAAQKTGDNFILAYLYRAYGRVLCHDGRYEEGIERLRKAFVLFSQLEMSLEVEETNTFINTCAG